jgi:hypothetical protein
MQLSSRLMYPTALRLKPSFHLSSIQRLKHVVPAHCSRFPPFTPDIVHHCLISSPCGFSPLTHSHLLFTCAHWLHFIPCHCSTFHPLSLCTLLSHFTPVIVQPGHISPWQDVTLATFHLCHLFPLVKPNPVIVCHCYIPPLQIFIFTLVTLRP